MIITTDGNHYLRPPTRGMAAGTSVVLLSGALGTATAVFAYKDEEGTFVALTDGVVTLPDQFVIEHGVDTPIFLSVSGGDAATRILATVSNKV